MHYKFSPSGSKKWLYCEGSLALEAELNLPDSTNAASELGTGVHEVGEITLNDYLNYLNYLKYLNARPNATDFNNYLVPYKFINRKMNGHVMTQDCIDAVTIYYEYCRDLIDKNGIENCWIEKTFVHPDCDELGGTSDFSSLDLVEGLFEIVDYKNGTGEVVWPEENSQAKIYGLIQYWNLPLEKRLKIKKFRLTIIQPRHYEYKPHDGKCSWDISLTDLMIWEDKTLLPAIDRIKAGKGKLKASDATCKWCKAWNKCDKRKSNIDHLKAMIEQTKTVVTPDELADFDGLFGNSIGEDKEYMDFDNSGVDPEKVEEYCRNTWVIENEKLILDFIKKSKEYAMDQLLKGHEFAGRKVIRGLKNTSYDEIFDVESLVEEVQSHYGFSRADLLKDPQFITITDLKKLLKSKKIKKGEIDHYLDGITERLDGDLKMVTIDKKGASVTNLTLMEKSVDKSKLVDVEILIFE